MKREEDGGEKEKRTRREELYRDKIGEKGVKRDELSEIR
jgi:hypothetical protein